MSTPVRHTPRAVGQPGAGLRVGMLQKELRSFRIPIFARLANLDGFNFTVLLGQDPKPMSVPEFPWRVVRSLEVRLGRRRVVLHPRLLYDAVRGKYDVLICEGSARVLTSVVLAIARPMLRTRVIWWAALYDSDRRTVGLPGGLKGRLIRRGLKNVDAFVAYSRAAVRAAIEQAHVPEERVFLAPNALDTDLLIRAENDWRAEPGALQSFATAQAFDDRPIVLFVGRLLESKRIERLLIAFRDLRERAGRQDSLLVLVGGGPDEDRLRSVVGRLEIGEHVRFCGEVRDLRAVCPFFLAARVFVLPGPGGLAVYHALAHGVPTIAAGADGTERDLIADGEDGYLVQPDDQAELTDRIDRVLATSRSEWEQMSAAAKHIARHEMHVTKMVAAFDAAVRLGPADP